MPKLIQDEFTAMGISPQRRYQLRRERDSKCRICGKDTIGDPYCPEHERQQKEKARLWREGQSLI